MNVPEVIAAPIITTEEVGSMSDGLFAAAGKVSPDPSDAALEGKEGTGEPTAKADCSAGPHEATKGTAEARSSSAEREADHLAGGGWITSERPAETTNNYAKRAYIKRWEEEALNHFKSFAWEDVVRACAKVLQLPGQTETNWDVLFEMGYAHMRLDDCETAVKYFRFAHRIDGRRPALRMVLCELRRRAAAGQWRRKKRGRGDGEGGSEEGTPAAKRPRAPAK